MLILGCASQKNLILVSSSIPISASYAENQIQLNDPIQIDNDELTINTLKFYLGTGSLNNITYHLVDFSEVETLSIELDEANHKSCSYFLGVDSLTNSSGAHGGDLDPANGMYWSWQSGYINFKIEGFLNDQEFTFHLGGFLNDHNSFKTIVKLLYHPEEIVLKLDSFIDLIKEEKELHLMSPSVRAVEFSLVLSDSFNICLN